MSERDFSTAVREHQPKLYRTACFLVGGRQEADDLLQDTLLEAWKGWERFEGRSSVYTWLYCILIRRYHRWQRRQMLRRRFFIFSREADETKMPTPIDPSARPGALMERDQQTALLWKLLDGLRPKHREVLVLRYAEEMNLEQMAETLRVPLGTVKSRLNHAHALLGEKLKRAGIGKPKP